MTDVNRDIFGDPHAYRRWRDRKLEWADADLTRDAIEISNPDEPSAAECRAILTACSQTNVALYRWRPDNAERSKRSEPSERRRVRQLAARLGLNRLDSNWLAGEDGISSLRVEAHRSGRSDFIPYTDKPIRWHTDGYYHPPDRRIDAMLLHCCQSAATGGVNRLLDHELVYILLRERDPELLAALFRPEAMTIPARHGDDGIERAAQAGPVFSSHPSRRGLHMRYTARSRSIEWHDDPTTRAAVKALEAILTQPPVWTKTVLLEPGMGVVCNNVLHDRGGFQQTGDHQRLLLRARFLDRIAVVEREEEKVAWTMQS